jgi:hypothetical protein
VKTHKHQYYYKALSIVYTSQRAFIDQMAEVDFSEEDLKYIRAELKVLELSFDVVGNAILRLMAEHKGEI